MKKKTSEFENQVRVEWNNEQLFKTRVSKSFRIDKDLADKIAKASTDLGVPESVVVRAALRKALGE